MAGISSDLLISLKSALTQPGPAEEAAGILNKAKDLLGTTGTTTAPKTAVTATAAGVTMLNLNGLEIKILEETVTLTNATQKDLTNTIPAGSVILFAGLNLNTAVTGDASGDDLGVKVGLGVTADPDKYGMTADLAKNSKAGGMQAWAVLGSAEQLTVKLAKTDGSAATEKFTAGGVVAVRVIYATPATVADAA